jgi:hypothetical protein
VALASIIGAMISKRLVNKYRPEKVIHLGSLVMTVGALLLLIVSTLPLSNIVLLMGILVSVFITLLGSGIALPNCLSLALVSFQDVIGTAGAIFSLGYYLLVSLITSGMSFLHNGSLMIMPLYFFILSMILLLFGRKFIV